MSLRLTPQEKEVFVRKLGVAYSDLETKLAEYESEPEVSKVLAEHKKIVDKIKTFQKEVKVAVRIYTDTDPKLIEDAFDVDDIVRQILDGEFSLLD